MPVNIANQKESLKLCAYNCLNYKSNTVGVRNIITNHDITYISEHWLDIREEYLLNEYKKNYFVFFSAVYDNTINTKGRPFGGTCWFINKKIDLIKYEMLDNFNERISRIRIKDNQSDYIDIFGIWLQCDDGTADRLTTFQSNLSLIAGYMKENSYQNNIIFGDFNASFERNNRFDLKFKDFVSTFNLTDCHKQVNCLQKITYESGSNKSKIDHCLIDNNLVIRLIDFDILDHSSLASDHQPISTSFEFSTQSKKTDTNERFKNYSSHKFNWKNINFKNEYTHSSTASLSQKINEFCFDESKSLFENVDNNFKKLTKLLVSDARSTEKNVLKKDKNVMYKKIKIKKDPEIYALIKEIDTTQAEQINHTTKINKLKKLKTNLRRTQRFKLFNQGINEAIDLESNLHLNKDKFWQNIKNHRRNLRPVEASESEKIGIDQFTDFYSNLFSHHDRPSNENQLIIENKVIETFESLSNKKPKDIDCFTEKQVEKIISELSNGKAAGFDQMTNEIIKYALCPELIRILTHIFNQMFKYAYTPSDFNISLITPIPKKGDCKSASDFRPISVSSAYAMIYERLANMRII